MKTRAILALFASAVIALGTMVGCEGNKNPAPAPAAADSINTVNVQIPLKSVNDIRIGGTVEVYELLSDAGLGNLVSSQPTTADVSSDYHNVPLSEGDYTATIVDPVCVFDASPPEIPFSSTEPEYEYCSLDPQFITFHVTNNETTFEQFGVLLHSLIGEVQDFIPVGSVSFQADASPIDDVCNTGEPGGEICPEGTTCRLIEEIDANEQCYMDCDDDDDCDDGEFCQAIVRPAGADAGYVYGEALPQDAGTTLDITIHVCREESAPEPI